MTENKIDFWKTPEGKIMRYGVHEHNTGLAILKNYMRGIEFKIENNIQFSKEDLLKVLDKMEDARQKCKDSMDYVYTKLKELQE